jgi:hypothetical protein
MQVLSRAVSGLLIVALSVSSIWAQAGKAPQEPDAAQIKQLIEELGGDGRTRLYVRLKNGKGHRGEVRGIEAERFVLLKGYKRQQAITVEIAYAEVKQVRRSTSQGADMDMTIPLLGGIGAALLIKLLLK